MEAPVLESDYKKIGDDRCLFNGEAPRRRPDRRERRSYSETACERKRSVANSLLALAPKCTQSRQERTRMRMVGG